MGWMICILLKVEHKKWVGGFVFLLKGYVLFSGTPILLKPITVLC